MDWAFLSIKRYFDIARQLIYLGLEKVRFRELGAASMDCFKILIDPFQNRWGPTTLRP